MGIRFKDIVSGGDSKNDRSVEVWWLLATAALFELGREFTPDAGVLKAIMLGDIGLYEREARNEGEMPSFRAIVKGEQYNAPPRKGNGVTNGH
jgi:hypothetical protein